MVGEIACGADRGAISSSKKKSDGVCRKSRENTGIPVETSSDTGNSVIQIRYVRYNLYLKEKEHLKRKLLVDELNVEERENED